MTSELPASGSPSSELQKPDKCFHTFGFIFMFFFLFIEALLQMNSALHTVNVTDVRVQVLPSGVGRILAHI